MFCHIPWRNINRIFWIRHPMSLRHGTVCSLPLSSFHLSPYARRAFLRACRNPTSKQWCLSCSSFFGSQVGFFCFVFFLLWCQALTEQRQQDMLSPNSTHTNCLDLPSTRAYRQLPVRPREAVFVWQGQPAVHPQVTSTHVQARWGFLLLLCPAWAAGRNKSCPESQAR